MVNYTNQGMGTPQAASRMSQVSEYVGLVDKDSEELMAIIERLEQRLNRVLRIVPQDLLKEQMNPSDLVPLAVELKTGHEKLQSAIRNLISIIDRLEV